MGSKPTDCSSRRELYHEADVVVVGAGIFGCAAAYALAEQGRSVILLERWMQEPDRIVGELLQPGGYEALKKIGLGHCVDGIDAIPCYGYNVIYRTNPVSIPYPTRGVDGELTHIWNGHGVLGKRDVGRSFHHGRFVGQLRKACLAHKNISVFETEVVNTIRGEQSDQILGVETRTKAKGSESGEKTRDYFFGQLTIIADGYNSQFRKEVTTSKPLFRSKFYALELIDTKLPQPGFGHVVIGDVAPILLYQIGTHETRALFDVPIGIPEASPANGGVRGYIKNHAIPALPESVRGAALKALEDGKIPRSMPNSWLPASKQTPRGMVLLGDANNMRHPLTGAGMTVAFNDVLVLSDLLHPSRIPDLGDSKAIQDAMNTLYWRRKNYTSILNVLAQALYALFAANDRIMRVLQLGCFGYFDRGITDGPCGLLGGIIQRPLVLAYHFFSVAFLGIWMHSVEMICSGPGPLGILNAPLVIVDAILILSRAAIVFLPLVWREGFV